MKKLLINLNDQDLEDLKMYVLVNKQKSMANVIRKLVQKLLRG